MGSMNVSLSGADDARDDPNEAAKEAYNATSNMDMELPTAFKPTPDDIGKAIQSQNQKNRNAAKQNE